MHKHFYESQNVQTRKRKGTRSGRHSFGGVPGRVRWEPPAGSVRESFFTVEGVLEPQTETYTHTHTDTHADTPRDIVNLQNRTASYFTSKQWASLGIAEICYPGQTSYSKSTGQSSKQERNLILGRRRGHWEGLF